MTAVLNALRDTTGIDVPKLLSPENRNGRPRKIPTRELRPPT